MTLPTNPYPVRIFSCWHVMSVVMCIASTVFATYIVLRNVIFYQNVDYIVEHCTINWESFYPCHFMHLYWLLNNQNSIYDLRCFLNMMFVFTIAVAAHYVFAAIIMIAGISRQNQLAMIPWLVIKAVVIFLLAGLILAETYVTGGSLNSQYFMIACVLEASFVMQWVFGYVAFLQLRQVNIRKRQLNSFDYIRFDN